MDYLILHTTLLPFLLCGMSSDMNNMTNSFIPIFNSIIGQRYTIFTRIRFIETYKPECGDSYLPPVLPCERIHLSVHKQTSINRMKRIFLSMLNVNQFVFQRQ